MNSLQQLLDAHQIQQCLLRYPVALDGRNLDLFDSIFAADARIDIPAAGVFDRAGYRAVCEAGLMKLDATHHFVNAPVLKIEGDRAWARSYLVAQHALNALAPDSTLLIGAWYEDELARIDGQWLIVARTGNAVWWDGNPAILGLPGLPGAFPRHAGHDCPAWLLGGA
jgi:hypothetical protein